MTLLREVTLADGARADVRLGGGRGRRGRARPEASPPLPGEDVLELDGYVLLPALAEPHTHLDKALTAERFGREFTELLAAIGAWHAYRETLGVDDIVEQGDARRAARARPRCDGDPHARRRRPGDRVAGGGGAAARPRRAPRPRRHPGRRAHVSRSPGPLGPSNRSLLREALAMGADVAGGAPHVDPDPAGHVEIVLEEAAAAGRPVDLHADENMREGLGRPRRADRSRRGRLSARRDREPLRQPRDPAAGGAGGARGRRGRRRASRSSRARSRTSTSRAATGRPRPRAG